MEATLLHSWRFLIALVQTGVVAVSSNLLSSFVSLTFQFESRVTQLSFFGITHEVIFHKVS